MFKTDISSVEPLHNTVESSGQAEQGLFDRWASRGPSHKGDKSKTYEALQGPLSTKLCVTEDAKLPPTPHTPL